MVMTPAWEASPCKWLPVALSFHGPIMAALYGPVTLSTLPAQEEELRRLDEAIDHQAAASLAVPCWPEADTERCQAEAAWGKAGGPGAALETLHGHSLSVSVTYSKLNQSEQCVYAVC